MSEALEDLTTPMTVAEMRKSIYDVMAIIGVVTTDWKPGAVTRTIVTACAIMLASLTALIALIARSGFLTLSAGAWKHLVARYQYGVEPLEATFATGPVRFTNTAGGVYVWDDPDDVTVETADGRQYRNTAPFTVPAFGTVTANFRANEAGSASTAFIGEIIRAVNPMAGVNVTNTIALVGQDAEEDAALEARCLDKQDSLSPNGPADAYAYIARSAKRADGSAIGVTRLRAIKDTFGNIDWYFGTPAGGVSGTVGDLTTDLGIIDELIQTQCGPLGVTPRCHSATALPIDVYYVAHLYNTPGVTEAQIKAAIRASLLLFFAKQPVGGNRAASVGSIWRSEIGAAISNTMVAGQKLPIYRVDIIAPSLSNTIAAIGEAPVLGLVTATIIQTSPEDL
jgi:hypothetical protein